MRGQENCHTVEELKEVIAEKIEFIFKEGNLLYMEETDKYEENACMVAMQMAKAILEDKYIKTLAVELKNKSIYFEDAKNFESKCKRTKKIPWEMGRDKAIEKICDIIKDGIGEGLALYTSRFSLGYKLSETMQQDVHFLMEYVDPELYTKIYPVFWIAMLNRNPREKYDFCKGLLDPIFNATEVEKYIFALLIDRRMEGEKGTIFSLIKKRLYSRKKKNLPNIDNVNEERERRQFVNFLIKYPPGKNSQPVFKNNLNTLIDLIKIGVEYGMEDLDPALFLYFIEQLTGWLGFYFFVQLADNTVEQYNIYSTKDKRNKIASLYCLKKYMRDGEFKNKYPELGFLYKSSFREILDIYDNISEENIRLIQEEGIDCEIYCQLYRELFNEKENTNENKCSNTDVLDYYKFVFMKGDEESLFSEVLNTI